MYLAGIGIRSALRVGLPSGGMPHDLFTGAITGLAQGVASIGLNYLTEEFDLNPLLANVGFSALSLGIEGLINESGFFDHVFGTYKKNALTFLGHSPKPNAENYWELDLSDMWVFREVDYNRDLANYLWQEAVYMSQILDFSKIVRERGLVEALNTYATGFFNAIAVNSMVNIAGSIGQYIKNKLDAGDYTLETMEDGSIAKKVDIENSNESALIGEDNDLEWLKGKTFEGGVVYGELGINTSTDEMGLTDGYIDDTYKDNLLYRMDIDGTHAPSLWIGNDGVKWMQLGESVGNFFDTPAYAYEIDYGEINLTDDFLQTNGTYVGNGEYAEPSSISMFFDEMNTILNTAGEDYRNYTDVAVFDFDWQADAAELSAGLEISGKLFEIGFEQEDDLDTVIKGYKIEKEAILDFIGGSIDANISIEDIKKYKFIEIGGKIYAAKATLGAEHHFPEIFGHKFGARFTLDGTLGSVGFEASVGKKMKLGVHWGAGAAGTVEFLIDEE